MISEVNDPLLTSDPPSFTRAQAQQIGVRHFGIEAQAKPLWSERDQNFRLRDQAGEQYVLKIANAHESPLVIDFQQQALNHISRKDPELPVPRILPDVENRDYALTTDREGREHMVRLITWLDGIEIEEKDASDALLRELGAVLARLGVALHDFEHPASHHKLLWDLKHAGELRSLLDHVEGTDLRNHVSTALGRFEEHVTPRLDTLRSQVIHADLNRGNVLVSQSCHAHVTGIIDFGDMVHTPLIMDLAIAAAYHLCDVGDPLARALLFIGSYHQVTPLLRDEAEILIDLLIARLCTSITLQMWRARLYPQNSEYLLVHGQHTRARLRHIMSFPRQDLQDRILETLGFRACR